MPTEPDRRDSERANLVDTWPEPPREAEPSAVPLAARLRLSTALRSDIGEVRQRNEDSCLAYTFDSGGHVPLIPLGIYIMADGMGGYHGGERASRVASRIAAHYLIQSIYLPLLKGDPRPEPEVITQRLHEAVLSAHESVHPPGYAGNEGTTLTIALVLEHQLYIAHVGDSRAYWLVNGILQMLTRDHSLVQKLQDEGKITAEEAKNHPYRNVLLRALGQEEPLEVDISQHTLPTKGKLLLCTDGLCGPLSDGELLKIVNQSLPPQLIADQLIEAALNSDGSDNISAIVVQFGA